MNHHGRLALGVTALLASSACSASCSDQSPERAAIPWGRIHSPEARQRGRDLYFRYCVLCHGEHADGRGARSMGLDRTPADFTKPDWSSAGAAARAYHAIRQGVPGTPMPSWSALSEEESWDLVAFLVSVNKQGV